MPETCSELPAAPPNAPPVMRGVALARWAADATAQPLDGKSAIEPVSSWLIPVREVGQVPAFDPIEHLSVDLRGTQFGIKASRARIRRLRLPLHTATVMFHGNLEERLHEKLSDAHTSGSVNHVQLLEEQRARKTN